MVKSPGPLEYVKGLQVPDHTTCVLEKTPIGTAGGISPLEVDLDGIIAAGKSTSSSDII